MPTVSYDLQRRVKRFEGQRWLLDTTIKVIGPNWDQGRLYYYGWPCSPDYQGAIMGLQNVIKKWPDIAREFANLAKRFEGIAKSNAQAGHAITAGDASFAAAIMYGAAQWPIFENTPLNLALERKKTECYQTYMESADHVIEAVEVPYQGRTLPAYLHLPIGYSEGEVPCVVMIDGMDAFKELAIFATGDRFLRRGMACLVIDGPGSGTALTREIWYDPDTYGEVGTAAFDLLAQRPEIDATRIMAWGLSFGSFWATQMAAAEPRFAACAVMYTCFQPSNWPLYEMASPTFKQRFMYMTGINDEAEFDAFTPKMDVLKISAKITMPYLVMAGEDDALSDVACTIEHLNRVPGPKELIMYTGADHGLVDARSGQLGPPDFPYIVDWLADRAAGKPLESTYKIVTEIGTVVSEPWGEQRTYDYGAPLGVERHLAGRP